MKTHSRSLLMPSLFSLLASRASWARPQLRLAACATLCFAAQGFLPSVQAQGFQPVYDLKSVPGVAADAPNLLAYGQKALDGFGRTVRTGDLNGDGITDVIVGAQAADVGAPLRADAGAVFIWFGKSSLQGVHDVAGVEGTAPDVTVWGASALDQLTAGGSLRVADLNGDGLDDLILGSSQADGPSESRSSSGEAYIVFGRASFPATLDLAVQGSGGADVTLYGPTSNDNMSNSGSIVAADFNGDGITDLLLAAPMADGAAEASSSAGEAYIVLGRAVFPPTLDLAVQGPGGADLTIYGATPNDFLTLGGALAAGDVNGDALADVVLGASNADGPDESRSTAGEVYVIFGRATFPSTLSLQAQGADGADVTLWGATGGDQFGASAPVIADVDNDGVNDLVVGASGADGPAESRNGAGEAYVILGRTTFPSTLDMSLGGGDGESPGADLTIYGASATDNITTGGTLLSGDLNRDGVADLIIGAPSADGPLESRGSAGEVYLVLGRASLPQTLDLSVQGNGGADVTIYGATGGDNLGISKTMALADMNGDSFTDLILGAPLADGSLETRMNAGEAYVVMGRPRFPAVLDVAVPGRAGASVTLWGATANDQVTSGGALAVGDVNGDGLTDAIFGAGNADGPAEGRNNAGEIYILYGVAVPEIDVAQPVGIDLADGVGKSFGMLATGRSKQLTFTIHNSGSADLSGLGLTIEGADAALFSVIGSPAAPLAPGASTTFGIAFAPDVEGVKEAVVCIASNDEDEPLFAIPLTGNAVIPVPPVVATLAADPIDLTAATLNATVNALGSAREVVFEYGTTPEYGTTVTASPGLVDGAGHTPVQVALTGLMGRTKYHFRVYAAGDLGEASGQDMTFTTPNRIPVCAPDSAKLLPGTAVTLDVLANDSDADGDVLQVTSVTPLVPENAGTFTQNGGTLVFVASKHFTGATCTYTVIDSYGGSATGVVHFGLGACSITPAAVTMAGSGGTYPVSITADCAWSVSDTLNWVTVTPASGIGNGTVLVTVQPHTSNNERSKAITIGGQTHTITQWSARKPFPTETLPTDSITTYHGRVERHPGLNDGLSSRLELTTTNTGSFTGKLVTGKTTQSFSGTFAPALGLPEWHAVVSLTGGGQSPRTLQLILDPESASITGGLNFTGSSTPPAAASAWRSTAAPAQYAAAYTFTLVQPDPNPMLPQGLGQGSFAVSASNGLLIVTGTLSDGSAFTGSTFVGPQGQVLLHQNLYSNTGSLSGALTITPGATVTTNLISGAPTWNASETIPASKKTTYRPAFGPLPLTATGSAVGAP